MKPERLNAKVKELAYEAGLNEEDLDMIHELGNKEIFSCKAMEKRWDVEPQYIDKKE